MKRKIYSILSSIVIAGILVTLNYFYGIFSPYNYISAKWDIARQHPMVVVYGEPNVTDAQAVKIAPMYGFTYKIAAGCNVSRPLANGIDQYNKLTKQYLTEKLGADWKFYFDCSVDSLFRLERVDTIRKFMLANKDIKRLERVLDSASNGSRHVYIWVLPHERYGANVRVGEMLPDSSIRVYEYYQVDPYNLGVSQILY